MKRQIFEVYARIVDSTGQYHILEGYPKTFDSKNYGNDVDKALKRAQSDAYSVASDFSGGAGDTRQLQTVTISTADGTLVDKIKFGALAEVPAQNNG